jgi:hypothetical protein
VAAVALTASLVVGAAGCGPGPEASPEVSTVVGDDDGLYRDPGRVVGERVVVAGSVREVLGEWVFRLAGEPASEHDLLVVHGGIAELRPGRALELTGMMRRFSLEDVERDLGIDLEDPAFEPYEGRYAIVAEDLRPLSPGTRFADEESLQGDEILATGTVAEVLAPAAIVVEGGLNTPEPTLVLTADPVAVTQGQEVTVQATVDEFERARARDVLGDLPVEVLERFSGFNYLEAGVVRGG